MKKKLNLILFFLFFVFAGQSQTWEKLFTGYNYIFKAMEFPGGQSQIGFAGGQDLTYMGDGIVIKTTNGGTTWTSLWTGVDQGVEDMSFPDMNTGYVGGWSAYFAKTTNGGATWTPQSPGTDVYIYTAMAFKDANNGVVAAQTNTGTGVYVTTNGGTTWTTGTGLAAIPYKLVYVTANTYFLVTNGGHIQKSTDGGLTWTTVTQGLGLLLGIDFYNPMTGIALAEDGWIHKTYDGGVTWTPQQTAFGNPLWRDVAWKNQNEVVTCGTPETIWKSLDGGITWNDDYPASTYNPALYEVIYTNDGIGYICGSQGSFYRKVPTLTAAFTANTSAVCNGGTVQFTDQSAGNPTSWNWTFEGGNPATSVLQNPLVSYPAAGTFDVTLQITKGSLTNTISNANMIVVDAPVTSTPSQPVGPAAICGSFNYNYTTGAVANATGYTWISDPANAGTFVSTGTTGTLAASNTWDGAFTVKVAGSNACGTGPVSQLLNCTLYHQPNVFLLFSGGGYCSGQTGYEIKLENSETGVFYQLFKDGVPSGSPVAGTGSTLSFGLQAVGTYTVTAVNGICSANMQGASTNYIIDPPGAAAQPTGPATTCNNNPSAFSASLPANGFTLLWTLSPSNAGTISQPTLTTAIVTWAPGYSGTVAVSVQGQNECGSGAVSPALTIMVEPIPVPVVTGNTSVCIKQEITYSTGSFTGSNYTWAVTGGTITSGQGTNEVTILWDNAGTGSVSVTETSLANCSGTSPLVFVAVDPCTGVTESKQDDISIYPNPAKDQLNIVSGSVLKTPVHIDIFNHAGQLVYQSVSDVNGGSIKVDVSLLKAGIYAVQVSNSSELFIKMFVKK